MTKIAVVGSINVDVVTRVTEYPVPGQTIKSEGIAFYYGGKGANQAVAAARAGGLVSMIGAVGTDPYGKEVLEALQANGLDTSRISLKTAATGMAFITVNAAGQNQIILAEGANACLLPDDVGEDPLLRSVHLILLQNEIPWDTNLCILQRAYENHVAVIVNPAPAIRLTDEVLPYIGTLILNESEAEHMTGLPVANRDDAAAAACQLLGRGVAEVILTLGAHGSLYVSRKGERIFTPAVPVAAVDTTSAGDTFIGYYAAGVCEGKPLEEALQFAAAAAALSVTRHGAQASIPRLEEVKAFIKS